MAGFQTPGGGLVIAGTSRDGGDEAGHGSTKDWDQWPLQG